MTNVYECMEERVNVALDALKDDVLTHKAECLVTADELRSEILTELQQIRSDAEIKVADATEDAENGEGKIEDKTEEAVAAV